MADGPLVCPRCSSSHPLSERFCPDCRMPLVYAGRTGVDEPVSERQERARKIKPQYAEGDPVRVAWARNQAEAELMAGMLLEEGIPSLLKRARGFDVPDFLAAGPRDVLVPVSGAEAAREVLMTVDGAAPEQASAVATSHPLRLAGWLVAGVGVVALLAWVGTQLAG
jgi:uncharacterized protein YbaR (Trm112 family)